MLDPDLEAIGYHRYATFSMRALQYGYFLNACAANAGISCIRCLLRCARRRKTFVIANVVKQSREIRLSKIATAASSLAMTGLKMCSIVAWCFFKTAGLYIDNDEGLHGAKLATFHFCDTTQYIYDFARIIIVRTAVASVLSIEYCPSNFKKYCTFFFIIVTRCV